MVLTRPDGAVTRASVAGEAVMGRSADSGSQSLGTPAPAASTTVAAAWHPVEVNTPWTRPLATCNEVAAVSCSTVAPWAPAAATSTWVKAVGSTPASLGVWMA